MLQGISEPVQDRQVKVVMVAMVNRVVVRVDCYSKIVDLTELRVIGGLKIIFLGEEILNFLKRDKISFVLLVGSRVGLAVNIWEAIIDIVN